MNSLELIVKKLEEKSKLLEEHGSEMNEEQLGELADEIEQLMKLATGELSSFSDTFKSDKEE
jgi:hypothetical protein